MHATHLTPPITLPPDPQPNPHPDAIQLEPEIRSLRQTPAQEKRAGAWNKARLLLKRYEQEPGTRPGSCSGEQEPGKTRAQESSPEYEYFSKISEARTLRACIVVPEYRRMGACIVAPEYRRMGACVIVPEYRRAPTHSYMSPTSLTTLPPDPQPNSHPDSKAQESTCLTTKNP